MKKENVIEIWQPRYKDNSVLIATYKIQKDNYVVFTKAKHLSGMKFYIDGESVRMCPTCSNGKIECYVVPMTELRRVDE